MRRVLPVLGLWLGALWLLSAVMPSVVRHYAATDNVRELFRADRNHVLSPHTWFLLLCLLVPASASLAARMLLGRRYLVPLLMAVAAPVAGWFCLRFAVTVESIHDIVGSPVLGWPYDLEYVARFSIVFCTLWVITFLGFLPGLWLRRPEAANATRPSATTKLWHRRPACGSTAETAVPQ